MTASLAFSLPSHARLFPTDPTAAAASGRMKPSPTWWQLQAGRGLNGRAAGIDRLIWLQAQAAAAESEGHVRRADFFWRETYAQLRGSWSDEAAWSEAARRLAAEPESLGLTGESLRARWSLEVLAQQHCAFFNGHLDGGRDLPANSRAFFHGERIAELLQIGGEALNAAQHLLPATSLARIEALRIDKRFDEAVDECARLVSRQPAEPAHVERLAGLCFERAMQGLAPGDSEADHRANAKRLRQAIEKFEQVRLDHPRVIDFYRGLGRCHRTLAVSLANAGDLAAALGAVRMASAYDPQDDEAERLEHELQQMMSQLQEQVAELERQLKTRPGTQLNEHGHRLAYNARQGFKALEESERLATELRLGDEFGCARDREVWHLLRLTVPQDRWEERARKLHEALLALMTQPPARVDNIEAAWQAQAAADADLRECDARAVCTFLRRRLFEEADGSADPTPAPAVECAPVTPLPSAPQRKSLEPFWMWLFAPRDWRVKLQVVAAAALVGGAVALQAAESRDRRVRNEAYALLGAAVGAGNDLGAIRAAEKFLAVQPRVTDGRDAEVRRRYDDAFARWFVADGHRLDADAQARIERYRASVSPAAKATP